MPFFAFFATDSGKRPKEAPASMLLAMGITAGLCLLIGVNAEEWLYPLLPYEMAKPYLPYTREHVLLQMQLLAFAVLAFALFYRSGFYPRDVRSINLDTDWIYRRGGVAVVHWAHQTVVNLYDAIGHALKHVWELIVEFIIHPPHAPEGLWGRGWPTGIMAFWTMVMLGVYLVTAVVAFLF